MLEHASRPDTARTVRVLRQRARPRLPQLLAMAVLGLAAAAPAARAAVASVAQASSTNFTQSQIENAIASNATLQQEVRTLVQSVLASAHASVPAGACQTELVPFVQDTLDILNSQGVTYTFLGYYNDMLIVAGNGNDTAQFRQQATAARASIYDEIRSSVSNYTGSSLHSSGLRRAGWSVGWGFLGAAVLTALVA